MLKGSWDGKIILGYLGEPNVTTSFPIRGTQKNKSQGRICVDDDSVRDRDRDRENWRRYTVGLNMEKGATSKECPRPLEAGKGKKTDSPLEPPEGTQACWPLDFRPVKLILDLQNCKW